MLTGRAWEVVSGDLGRVRTDEEMAMIHSKVGEYFVRIADLLARVPRELLLMFKVSVIHRRRMRCVRFLSLSTSWSGTQ